MVKWLALATSCLTALWPVLAVAQDIPAHSMPIGQGPGVVGWGVGGPCNAGQVLVWQGGPGADPSCATAGGGGGGFPATSQLSFFVATTGDNANNCITAATACFTIEYVIRLCPIGTRCVINIAPGTYVAYGDPTHPSNPTDPIAPMIASPAYNTFYYRTINFSGKDPVSGSCNVNNVNIHAGENGQTIFESQDHAVIFVSCLTFVNNPIPGACGGSPCTGVFMIDGRQLAIVDADDIQITNNWVNGTFLSATDLASVNCGNTFRMQSFGTAPNSLNALGVAQARAKLNWACQGSFFASGSWTTAAFVASGGAMIDLSGGSGFPSFNLNTGVTITGPQCNITQGAIMLSAQQLPPPPPAGGGTGIPGTAGSCTTGGGGMVF